MNFDRIAELDDRELAIGLSRARCVIGLSCIVAPSLLSRAMLGDASPAVRAATRFAGIRDLALGVGALNSLKDRSHDAEWVSMGAISDAFDGVVAMMQPGLPLRGRAMGAGALGLGGYLLMLSRRLSHS